MPHIIPPHVTPPKSVKRNLALLRQTANCVIETWPEEMYHKPFCAAPIDGVLYVTQPDAVAEVLLNRDGHFEQSHITRRVLKPIWRSGLAAVQNKDWRWQRRAAAPVFTPASVEAIIPAVIQASDALLQRWQASAGTVEVTKDLGDTAQQVVIGALLGSLLDPEEAQAFLQIGAALIAEMNRFNYADLLLLPNWTRRFLGPTMHGVSGKLHDALADILISEDQAQTAGGPLLEQFARAYDPESGSQMGVERLRDNIVGIMGAGRETTALAISWAMMLLALDKDAQMQLRDEAGALQDFTPEEVSALNFTRAVLMEAMRLYPPAPQFARDSLQDTEIAGRPVKRGTLINIPIYAIHRHHALWDQPDAFIADRFLTLDIPPKELRWRYLPFGGGAHICLGQAFAMTEAVILLARIVQHFEISLPDDFDLRFQTGASLRPRGGLHLTLTPLR